MGSWIAYTATIGVGIDASDYRFEEIEKYVADQFPGIRIIRSDEASADEICFVRSTGPNISDKHDIEEFIRSAISSVAMPRIRPSRPRTST